MSTLTDSHSAMPGRLVRRIGATLVAATLGVATFAHAASADPINATTTPFPAICDGTEVQLVNNGNGDFSAAHVIGSTAVFVVHSSTVTFEITRPGETTPEIVTESASKRNPRGDLVTCNFDVTETTDEGTVRVFGSATGVFRPRSRASA